MILTWVKDVFTIIGPLIGVWVGTRLSGRSTDERWLREQRLQAYLALLEHMERLVQQFAVGLRVNKFGAENAVNHGHDLEATEQSWHDLIDDLRHFELRVSLLGGQLGDRYERLADVQWSNMLDAIENKAVTEEEWDHIVSRGRQLIGMLERSARQDMGVARRSRDRLRLPYCVRPAGGSAHDTATWPPSTPRGSDSAASAPRKRRSWTEVTR